MKNGKRKELHKLPVIKKTHGTVQKRKIDRMMMDAWRFSREGLVLNEPFFMSS